MLASYRQTSFDLPQKNQGGNMAKKIIVLIKQVPDTETRFKVAADGKTVDITGTKWVVNPYDEFAIEEALKIKTTFPEAQTVALSVGPKSRTVEALRTALAMGIEEAVAIDSSVENLNHNQIAQALARGIEKEGDAFLILAGKLAIDDNAAAVPLMTAEALNWNHVSIATQAQWGSDEAHITRELEGGVVEKIKLNYPAVVSCNKGLNTPRYPSLPGIMKAKKKTIKEWSLADLQVEPLSLTPQNLKLPAERAQARILSGDLNQQIDELVKLLREDAKVL